MLARCYPLTQVADVQIDPIEDINDEAAQDLLKSQAQLLLDCFSDLFVCQGPHGMLNILRAGYPDLDVRSTAECDVVAVSEFVDLC